MSAKKPTAFASNAPEDLETLLDQLAIFACLRRIARGMDRFDRELFLSGFHPDALIEAGVIVSGPEDSFEAGVMMHDEAQESTLHYLMNHNSEIDGDLAHGETYFLFVGHNRDGTNFATGGRYVDRLERRGGRWKVSFRHTILEWSGTIPTETIPLFGNAPDLHRNGVPSRSKEDPSYRRPFTNCRAVTGQLDPRNLTKPSQSTPT